MTNEDINKKVKSVVNSIEFIEDEDYEYLHKEGVEIEIKKNLEEIETLRTQLAKANERVERCEKIFSEAPDLTFYEVQIMFSDELNKFAIEKRIDEIDRCKQFFAGRTWRAKELELNFEARLEQLRKEQE